MEKSNKTINFLSPNKNNSREYSSKKNEKVKEDSDKRSRIFSPKPNKFKRRNTKSKTYLLAKSKPTFNTVISSSTKTFQNPQYRDYMEDIPLTVRSFLKDETKNLFCIFDGHGGDQTAKICESMFPDIFAKCLKENPGNIEKSLIKAFEEVDQETKRQNCIEVGNTATVVYITNKTLYCANVGDSSCIIVKKDLATKISYDDKCTDLKEKKRIKAAGGSVSDKRLDGILAISRGIGDQDLKDKGLISEPHIYRMTIYDYDKFCIIASDGVWDVVTEKDIYEICKNESNNDLIVGKIIDEAISKGSQDNISCIVISLSKD